MKAIKELLLKMADDELFIGHRGSEWTGLGPTLEEDIAFSSMSQDKIGHSLALYKILHKEYGEPDPDRLVFDRKENEYNCCHLVEFPTDDYAMALVRQFFFDHAEFIRYDMLSKSSNSAIMQLAKKIKGELKYHIMHADVWMKKLGTATVESNARMQSAVNEVFPLALGIFEPGDHEKELNNQGIFEGEEALKRRWLDAIQPILDQTRLKLPNLKNTEPVYGGRKGYHTSDFKDMLSEMTEVYRTEEAGTEW